jgi:alkanesulfonate monooxygenase SsuD/methylene tetrahydromethanopterin reductase-like flavin-dependent oxidoreductase (luciferase family)
MHVGLIMECDYREGRTQEEAFDEAFATAETAETLGFDGVWLAERHFAGPRNPLDPQGAGIPSVVSAPLIFATAILSRTSRLRVGTAVLVLPLGHPVRMAEEVATIDHISRGRLDLGIGRSGFPRAYQGYDIPYAESRERFREYLEVMRQAWTQERFSYAGQYYTFKDVCLIPKPYQKPYPPLRYAATTKETFALMGRLGLPIFVGLRGMTASELMTSIGEYRQVWRESGHAGEGSVVLRVPVYVAETQEQALSEAEASTMLSYARLRQSLAKSAGEFGTTLNEERAERAARLATITYEDLLRERLAYGTPQMVAERLGHWRDTLGLSGVLIEPNVGGQMVPERVRNSIRLFAQEVAPALR